jgi:LmbE family N-acetylglucosaminyl deacetylase
MRQWGLPLEHELDRVVMVSPHLDDAVLGAARVMAAHPGCHVITVFAGNPPAYPDPMRLWDVQSGFGPGDDVMEVRRKEDHAALALLDATPVHLDFVEYTYNPGDVPVSPDVIAPVLDDALRGLRPTLVVAPFGLANPDHDVTHCACMRVRSTSAETQPDVSWWCYEDM